MVYVLSITTLFLISFIIRGFIFCQFWKWFIIPIFNTQPLTIPIAIGLSWAIMLFTGIPEIKPEKWDKNFGDKLLKTLYTNLVKNGLVYLIGYIISLFL